ncbi:hypothetical protein H5V38_09300 [Fusobacterium hwasookii]|uniref:hypothetical protein n=1 Tax=Fusobacterium hwasookii TaxID=1583098 RepID=UPI000495FEFB|nr:hypothetical protein [Fusobacterium hwasookii]QNE68102.1 hypothetical protein H5V38_09300 [Fusobacterium hwasookii]
MKKFLFISLLFFSISILIKGIEIFEYIPFLFNSSVADNLPQQFLNELDKKIVFTGKMEDTEKIVTIYKDGNLNPIFHKRLDSSTVTDAFFLDYINDEESIFYNLLQDKVPFYY